MGVSVVQVQSRWGACRVVLHPRSDTRDSVRKTLHVYYSGNICFLLWNLGLPFTSPRNGRDLRLGLTEVCPHNTRTGLHTRTGLGLRGRDGTEIGWVVVVGTTTEDGTGDESRRTGPVDGGEARPGNPVRGVRRTTCGHGRTRTHSTGRVDPVHGVIRIRCRALPPTERDWSKHTGTTGY